MNDPRATMPAHQGNNHGTQAAPHAPHAPHVQHAPGVAPAHQPATRIPVMPLTNDDQDSLPIELSLDAEEQVGPSKKIRAFGIGGVAQKDYKRPTYANRTGAVRVKSFHGKLSDQGMDYLDNAINDWLEAHPEHEVKFVTSSVGLFDGKIKEPALILNVWY
jgi:hypothetical protein